MKAAASKHTDQSVESSGQGEAKRQRRPRKRWSFRTTLVLAFSATAFLTVALALGMMAIVFATYFSSYTTGNLNAVTAYLGERISQELESGKTLPNIDYDEIVESLQLNRDAGVLVSGVPNGAIYYYGGAVDDTGDLRDFSGATQTATVDIFNDGNAIGTVSVFLYGSDALVGRLDEEFRNRSYEAMILAGLAAVLIATAVGLWFSYKLGTPIERVTNAARCIARGDLKARTHLKGSNEIETLGATFDTMAESIERDQNLEKRLTSDVAHELRTPLMAMQATVEAMLDGVYKADSEHLLIIDSEVRRLSRLVDAMLMLSRLERRSRPLNEQICDLAELVNMVVDSHEVFAKDAGLLLQAHTQENVKVIADSDMIRQAIANLVSNAVRYTPEGGRIDIYIRRYGPYAAIDVSDTGIGLTPEEERMVFSRFWRSDASRAQESGGLGVGLAVVKEIVNRHNGRVGVKGVKGVGSTFSIYLPALAVSPAEMAANLNNADEQLRRDSTHKSFNAKMREKPGSSASVVPGSAVAQSVNGVQPLSGSQPANGVRPADSMRSANEPHSFGPAAVDASADPATTPKPFAIAANVPENDSLQTGFVDDSSFASVSNVGDAGAPIVASAGSAKSRELGFRTGRFAAIDIGTVTCRMIVADVVSGPHGTLEVVTLDKEYAVTNLGEGVDSDHVISHAAMSRVVDTIDSFLDELSTWNMGESPIISIVVVATSAMRDAKNPHDLEDMLSKYGLALSVISGKAEAALSFMGASKSWDGENVVVVDIGGGSTEISFGVGGLAADRSHSFDIGCRRLTERFWDGYPPSSKAIEDARVWVRSQLEGYEVDGASFFGDGEDASRMIAVAGTATSVVAMRYSIDPYDPDLVDGAEITIADLRELELRLADLSLEELENVTGLDPKRAPVIVSGMVILEEVMRAVGVTAFTASEADLLEGMIMYNAQHA